MNDMAKTTAAMTTVAKKTTAAKKAPRTSKSSGFDPTKYICNVVPSKETERDWTYAASVQAGALTAVAALPASVDLRAPTWSINNQNSTGSCVGWATADGVGRYLLERSGKLTGGEMLSPRYIWMGSKETDIFTNRPESFIEVAGTTLKAAMDIARKYGFALEADLPFEVQTHMYLGDEDEFYARCAMRKIAAYFNLKKNLAQWKSWLATKGPILAGLQVDRAWDDCGSTGGVVGKFRPASVRGGHAVAVVGYRADGRFIVRNSWGTGFGDDGFAYVSPSYISAAFFEESYGATL
jgi:C1A family cysteine protease